MLSDFDMGKDFEKMSNKIAIMEGNIDNLFAWTKKDAAISNHNIDVFFKNLNRVRTGAMLIGVSSILSCFLITKLTSDISKLEKRVSDLEKVEEKQDTAEKQD